MWQQGVQLTRMAAAEGVRLSPSTLTSVLGACAKKARWAEALDVLREARPVLRQQNAIFRPDPQGPDTVPEKVPVRVPPSAAYAAEGHAPSVASNGAAGKAAAGDGSKRKVDHVVPAYTLAMVACREADRSLDGLRVLRVADEDGVRGDEAFFRVGLRCCAKVGVIDEEGAGAAGLGRWAGPDGAAVGDMILEEMATLGLPCGVEGFSDLAQVSRGPRGFPPRIELLRWVSGARGSRGWLRGRR